MNILRYMKLSKLKQARKKRDKVAELIFLTNQQKRKNRTAAFANFRNNYHKHLRDRIISDQALESRVVKDIRERTKITIPPKSLFMSIDWQTGLQLSGVTCFFIVDDIYSVIDSAECTAKKLIKKIGNPDETEILGIEQYMKALNRLQQIKNLHQRAVKFQSTGKTSHLSAFRHANIVKRFRTDDWYGSFKKLENKEELQVLVIDQVGRDASGQGGISLTFYLESNIIEATQFMF